MSKDQYMTQEQVIKAFGKDRRRPSRVTYVNINSTLAISVGLFLTTVAIHAYTVIG